MGVPSNPVNDLHVFEFALVTLYTDKCGRFPTCAQSGNKYIMVAYHDKANMILIKGFQTRHNQHRIPAYNAIMQQLKDRGIAVTNHVLDNQARKAYKAEIIDTWKCTYQLVPLDMQQQNIAERAICTFKAHFLAILAGVDLGFPKSRWDLLLPQAEITLNIL